MAELLIVKGADVDAKSNTAWGETPLIRTIAWDRKDVAKFLIAKGADVNIKDKWEGITPLHLAAGDGDMDLAVLLIGKGAEINVKNKKGKTPLSLAKEKGHEQVVELLRKHGAKE